MRNPKIKLSSARIRGVIPPDPSARAGRPRRRSATGPGRRHWNSANRRIATLLTARARPFRHAPGIQVVAALVAGAREVRDLVLRITRRFKPLPCLGIERGLLFHVEIHVTLRELDEERGVFLEVQAIRGKCDQAGVPPPRPDPRARIPATARERRRSGRG